ncbi:hypothetical protein BSKO_01330 [Bryopsis sp. KO-2023]|nr:hypothetical protein BSKO_01330 [Bryopsis sp. KO-2023]
MLVPCNLEVGMGRTLGSLDRLHRSPGFPVVRRRRRRVHLKTVAFEVGTSSRNGCGPAGKVKKTAEEAFSEYIEKEGCGQVSLSSIDVAPQVGLAPKTVHRNLSPSELYEMAVEYEQGTHIVSSGALATLSGAKTGRSPKDKRVVVDDETESEIWRGEGSPNFEISESSFLTNREMAINFLNTRDRLFVFDGFANWDQEARIKIRVVCSRAYHALFMHNMMIRPSQEELDDFGEPDFTIFNAGECKANKHVEGVGSDACVGVSLKHNQMVILGTEYAGEMKKGVFSVMHYLMPKRDILSLHSGCNVGQDGDVSLFFGLSGTGKTTLSADPNRPLIGDDEHCWSSRGISNIEGGCYAKCIGLKPTTEPEIYDAIRYGTVLENVVYDPVTRDVDFDSGLLTENTRASYPIEFIANAQKPCVGPHPKNVILLCCDAFGVLPPVSKLNLEQAMYHFISGYTAKVAGTEVGIVEPEATFSACFGGAFLMWHPMKYAAMLEEKMKEHGTSAWLVNTGWTGGSYGVGHRISLKHTRAIIDGIHSGELDDADFETTPIFNLHVPKKCSGVPSGILLPEKQWGSQKEFHKKLDHLGHLFEGNFEKYKDGGGFVSEEVASRICSGGPVHSTNV